MCTPLAAVAAVGVGMQVVGQVQQGQAANAAAKYQAGMLRNNVLLAGFQADQEAERAEWQKQELDQAVGALRGQGRVGFAAGNVLLNNRGTVLDWEGTLDRQKMERKATIDWDTKMSRWALQMQALGYGNQAELTLAAGRNAQTAGLLSGAGTALQGAGTVATLARKD